MRFIVLLPTHPPTHTPTTHHPPTARVLGPERTGKYTKICTWADRSSTRARATWQIHQNLYLLRSCHHKFAPTRKKILKNLEKFRKILKHFEKSWKILTNFWKILKNFEKSWNILKNLNKNFEKSWKILKKSRKIAKIFEKLARSLGFTILRFRV